jgi:hypothetical protein
MHAGSIIIFDETPMNFFGSFHVWQSVIRVRVSTLTGVCFMVAVTALG